ncbi:MAG: DUF1501 domain-containing protein [Pirellulales bacterium]
MLSRRQFIARSGSLISMASCVPTMLCRAARAAAASRDAPVLVVIQLDGGNDGLNTVVPYADDAYVKARSKLHVPAKDVHKLSDSLGLHPRMRAAKELFDDGRLAIVQGVGYPNPDRSHFRSMRIWQTATFDDAAHNGYGWLGRSLDGDAARQNAAEAAAVYVGEEQAPVALWGRRSVTTALSQIDDLTLSRGTPPRRTSTIDRVTSASGDESLRQFVTRQVVSAYAAANQIERRQRTSSTTGGPSYPDTTLAARLRVVSQLLKSGSAARVFYAIQSGYDTHAAQVYTHGQLLAEFSQAIKAFLDDLQATELSERVIVLAFSEFGRRVQENDSLGTDHGAAGPVFLAGKRVTGGLIGPMPDLAKLDAGDLPMTTDFRQIYATLLDKWLGIDSQAILGGTYQPLPLLTG